MQILKSSACLQCKHHRRGKGMHNLSQHMDMKCPRKGHRSATLTASSSSCISLLTLQNSSASLPVSHYVELSPHTNKVNLQKKALWKRELSVLQALLPYLLHKPRHSFFGKPGLRLSFNGESFSNPLYSINLIKGFADAIQDC